LPDQAQTHHEDPRPCFDLPQPQTIQGDARNSDKRTFFVGNRIRQRHYKIRSHDLQIGVWRSSRGNPLTWPHVGHGLAGLEYHAGSRVSQGHVFGKPPFDLLRSGRKALLLRSSHDFTNEIGPRARL
jgi:hypothetical protein